MFRICIICILPFAIAAISNQVLPFLLVGIPPILIEIYSRIPLKIVHGSTPTLIPIDNKAKSVFIIFPGFGGPDKNTG
jgi:hypothetical protein